MKSHHLSIAILLGLLMLSGLSCNHPVDKSADMEAIQKLSDEWTRAIISRDVDRILTGYAVHAVQMQGKIPILSGHQAIRSWYESWINDTTMTYTAQTKAIDIADSKDLAYERGVYCFSFKTPAGHTDQIGKYLTVWKKIDGQWKVVADIGNDDQ